MLRCRGVAEQRAIYLGSLASLPEALGDLDGLLSFWSELGWLEYWGKRKLEGHPISFVRVCGISTTRDANPYGASRFDGKK
ncbi:jg23166, partial [Pararge aegeria aegeria]